MKELLFSAFSAFVAVMIYKMLTERSSKSPESDIVVDREADLKPCPFCGGAAEIFTAMGTTVSCVRCRVSMYDFDRETVIKKWNQRVNKTEVRP